MPQNKIREYNFKNFIFENLSGVNIIDKTMPTRNAARETAMVIKNDRKSSSPHPF